MSGADEARWLAVWAHRPRLLAVARRRCINELDVEDVVGEAMLRAATFAELDEDRLGRFLTAVTARLCVDANRRRAAHARACRRLGVPVVPDAAGLVDEQAEARWLAAQAAGLSVLERAALNARADGMTLPEAAVMLGVSYRAVSDALGRARVKLRDAYRRTLAVLAVVCGVRRCRGRMVPLLPAVAVALSLAVMTVPQAGPGGGGPRRPVADTTTAGSRVPGPTPARSPAAQPAATPAASEPGAGPGTARPAGTEIAVPGMTAGPVRRGGVRVWVDDEDPVEQIMECVRDGVAVTGTSIICR